MGDISFLSDKSDNSRKNDSNASSVKWSVPAGSDKNDFLSGTDAGNSRKKSGFFSFGKKEEKTVSKEQLEAERAEVINALNSQEESHSLFSFFGAGKKKKSLAIDFEADFKDDLKHRDTKIDRALGQASLPSSTSFSVPIDPPMEEKNKVIAGSGTDDIASYRTTMFDRLIDRWLKKKTAEEIEEESERAVEAKDILSPDASGPDTEAGVPAPGEMPAEKPEAPVVEKKKDEKVLKDSDVLETNLMEGESISFFDWQRNLTTLGIFSFMAVILVGMAYAGLVIYGEEKTKNTAQVTGEIDVLTAKIAVAQEETKEFAPQEKKINLVSALLSKHIYWTNFFGFLEDYTISDVYYGSFAGDSNGKYTLSARAKNFNNLTEQLKVFKEQKKYVTQVNISGGKLAATEGNKTTAVDFSLDITLNKSVFNK